MRICKIWDADYPWDIRIEKIAVSLAEAGHEVHLVCRNLGRLPREEWAGKFHIHRLPALASGLDPVHALCNFPHPFSPIWAHQIARVVRTHAANLILVRDIPLTIPAIMVARWYGIPVVLDMAENYPAMLKDLVSHNSGGWLWRAVRHPSLAAVNEKIALHFVDHVIVVAEEMRQRLVRLGYPDDRITVVTNTPRIHQWNSTAERGGLYARGGLHLVYLGNLDGSRGVDVAVRAMARLKEKGVDIRFTIIGQGPSKESLEGLVRDLALQDRVAIRGRLPFKEVQELMAEADLGIIPHYGTEAWNTTMPNKLFDYMLWAIPVIVSDVKPVATIVRQEDCGEIFQDRNVESLAQCVEALISPDARARKGDNGRRAIMRRYHWKHEEDILINALRGVSQRKR